MKNKGIIFFLILIAMVIVAIIAVEFISSRPDRQPANPYALETDSLYAVRIDMITWREFRQMKLNLESPSAISGCNGILTITGDQILMVITVDGRLIREKRLDVKPSCVKTTLDRIYVGAGNQVLALDTSGNLINRFSGLYDSTLISCIDVLSEKVFIADAGKRMVYRYNREGIKELEFNGKSSSQDGHGFIIPSPDFDLAFSPSGELWVVNPGKHAMENYTTDGELRGWWEANAADITGFSGCCNPAHFAFLPDGNFVTSEKRIIRIKEYRPSGEFSGVVAAPSLFENQVDAPDIYCDESGKVYLLDNGNKMIRVFEKISK